MRNYKIVLIAIITIICMLPTLSFAAENNYLFIVNAKKASIEKSHGVYILKLKDVDSYTTYFSNRPQHITGLMKTSSFIKNWQQTFGKNSTSPNVAVEGIQLHSISKDAKDNVIVVTLSNPVYTDDKLTFQMTTLDKNASLEKFEKFKHAVLFIDNGYCPCCAVGGCDLM